MHKKKILNDPHIILWFFVLFHIVTTTIAQPKAIDSVEQKFNLYRTQSLQEKIYLHLDRSLYITGEILWFKAYSVDGTFHKPLSISRVAYIEILDAANHVVVQTKIELTEGFGQGSLFLSASLASGTYQVRAYTQWMRNAPADFFFHKTITVVNTLRKSTVELPPSAVLIDAQFFPEGGNLVNGLTSKIGFRVVNRYGSGLEFKGIVLNQHQDTIAIFHPLHAGLGNFELTPKTGDQYHAVIIDRTGNVISADLPKAFNNGFTMHVSDSTDTMLKVTVNAMGTDLQTDPIVYLFGHARQQIWCNTIQYLKQNKATFLIPKIDLPDGVSHLTIFNGSRQPVCERLYCKQPERKLSIALETNQSVYDTRKMVSITIDVKSQSKEVGYANLSVSVFKNDSLTVNDHENILSYLWLTSDLTGNIESPDYYFNRNDKETKEALDNVMLTHGWRRFVWKDILTPKKITAPYIPESHGHFIKGIVSNPQGVPAKNTALYLSTPGKTIPFYPSRSNEKGEIQFEMHDFYGQHKIIIQPNLLVDSTSKIVIQNPFSTDYTQYAVPEFKLSETVDHQLLSRSVAMQVQDIYYEDYTTRFINTITDSTAFYGKADQTFWLDDYTRFPVMEEVMREYVPGVYVRKRKDGFHFLVMDNINKTVFQDNPLVLLDGIPIFDVDQIMAFDPLKIKKLEVLTRKYFVGQFTFPGIVSYTTYQGDLGGFEINSKSITLNYEGLQQQREFFSPVYQTQQQRNSRLPDQRNLLFWSPSVITNQNGKQQIQFYTSDLFGEYRIVVEGIAKDGSAGEASSSFVIKNNNP